MTDAPANLLLAALAPEDFARLRPHLTRVTMVQGHVLQEPGAPIEFVYFPLIGMISLLATFETGQAIEIATIGREGATGMKIGLHPQFAFARAIVQLPGSALRMGLREFQAAAQGSLGIIHLSTCANDVMIANLQQSAGCNALHELEARMSRWLLQARDQFDDDSLPLTQEFLSQMLGVRRTTVQLAATNLEKMGAVRNRRGGITISDRAKLESLSCECYRAVRRNIGLIYEVAKAASRI